MITEKEKLFIGAGALIVLIIFVWNIKGNNSPVGEEQKSLSNSQSSTQQNFILNQECLSFKDEIAKKLEVKDSPFGNASLEQIFYSKKVNSCVYVEYTERGGFYNKRLFDIRNDGYSSKPLIMCSAISPLPLIKQVYEKNDGDLNHYQRDLAGCDSFETKLAEYR